MELKKEMKYFTAVTYNGDEYNFVVTPQDKIYCVEFGIGTPADQIEIKPDFILRNKKGETIYTLDNHLRRRENEKSKGDKIFKWNIEPELFKYLVDNKLITYSTFSAELFGFDEIYPQREELLQRANDRHFQKSYCKRLRKNPEARSLRLQKLIKEIYE